MSRGQWGLKRGSRGLQGAFKGPCSLPAVTDEPCDGHSGFVGGGRQTHRSEPGGLQRAFWPFWCDAESGVRLQSIRSRLSRTVAIAHGGKICGFVGAESPRLQF